MGMRISESMSNVSFHCRGFALKFSHSPPVPPPPPVLRARQFQRRHFAAALVYLAVAVALPVVVIKRVLALSDDSSQSPNKASIGVAYRVVA